MLTDTPKDMSIAPMVGVQVIPMALPITVESAEPKTMPISPPIVEVTAASMTNCVIIDLRFAPSALRIPISRVRSVTDTSIIFITPTPATRSDIPAIPPSMSDIWLIMDFISLSIAELAYT